jgi:hypothetical protein
MSHNLPRARNLRSSVRLARNTGVGLGRITINELTACQSEASQNVTLAARGEIHWVHQGLVVSEGCADVTGEEILLF